MAGKITLGIRNIHKTGLVFSAQEMTKTQAQALAVNGQIVLRRSSYSPERIILTGYHLGHQQLYDVILDDYIKSNPDDFATPALALKKLTDLFTNERCHLFAGGKDCPESTEARATSAAALPTSGSRFFKAAGASDDTTADMDLITRAKFNLRASGVVHPASMTRQSAEDIAKTENCLVLRESTSLINEIAVTFYSLKTAKCQNVLIKDLINEERHLQEFNTPSSSLRAIKTIFNNERVSLPETRLHPDTTAFNP